MMIPVPYCFTNKEWFEFDEEKEKYVLTDKAPQKSIESYNEFYNDNEGETMNEKKEEYGCIDALPYKKLTRGELEKQEKNNGR